MDDENRPQAQTENDSLITSDEEMEHKAKELEQAAALVKDTYDKFVENYPDLSLVVAAGYAAFAADDIAVSAFPAVYGAMHTMPLILGELAADAFNGFTGTSAQSGDRLSERDLLDQFTMRFLNGLVAGCEDNQTALTILKHLQAGVAGMLQDFEQFS